MKHNTIVLIWLIGGLALMILEPLLPGLIIIFFGAGAIITGLLLWLNIISQLQYSILFWFVISLVLILIFRKILIKFFPSDSSYQLIEEDVDAVGHIVEVLKEVNDSTNDGRISYNGTSWPAQTNNGIIEAGKKARIIYRDNISWVIEPCDEDE